MKPTLKAEWKTPKLRTLDVARTLSPDNTGGFS